MSPGECSTAGTSSQPQLTPRSAEACRRTGVDPRELVPLPPEAFKERGQQEEVQQQLDEARRTQPSTGKAGTRLSGKLAILDVVLSEAIASSRLQVNPSGSSDSWVELSQVGTNLVRQRPDWDVRTYGVSKSQGLSGLLELPELQGLFEIRKRKHNLVDVSERRSRKTTA